MTSPQNNSAPKILGIVHTHANRILYAASELYCTRFREQGFDAQVLDLGEPGALENLGTVLSSGAVAFAFGIQGIGSKLETGDGDNLWAAAQVPFLCLHYDNPCYNPVNHVNDSPYVANFYFFPSFLELKHRYLPSAQVSALLPFELLEVPPAPRIPFADRPIKLLLLKTGATLDEPVAQLNSLNKPLRDAVFERLKYAELNPNFQICDLTQEVFDRNGIDRDDHPKLFWGIAQVMDIYLRRKRAIDFVNWLKFQPGAVIVGNGWESIDRTGSCAEFRPSIDAAAAFAMFEQTQIICNINPYGRDIIHERTIQGLLMGCGVISDSNTWSEHTLGEIPTLQLFHWDQPLDAQLLAFIADPLIGTKTAAARDTTIAKFRHQHTITMMIDGAQQITEKMREFATTAPNAAAASGD